MNIIILVPGLSGLISALDLCNGGCHQNVALNSDCDSGTCVFEQDALLSLLLYTQGIWVPVGHCV